MAVEYATDAARAETATLVGLARGGDTEAFVSAIIDLYNLKVARRSEREIRLEPAA